jgi:hypothetical protein
VDSVHSHDGDDETKSDMPVIESKKENGITGGKVHVIVRYRNYQFALLKDYATNFVEIYEDIAVHVGIATSDQILYISPSWPLQKSLIRLRQ